MGMKKKHLERRHLVELLMKTLMQIALVIVAGALWASKPFAGSSRCAPGATLLPRGR